jgi:hypothetical protein
MPITPPFSRLTKSPMHLIFFKPFGHHLLSVFLIYIYIFYFIFCEVKKVAIIQWRKRKKKRKKKEPNLTTPYMKVKENKDLSIFLATY